MPASPGPYLLPPRNSPGVSVGQLRSPRHGPPLAEWSVAHGFGFRFVCVLVAWLAVLALTRVGIPAVNPRLDVADRPLETLGTVALAAPAALQAAMLNNTPSWLAATSPRSPSALRGYWLLFILAVSCAFSGLWVLTLPSSVPQTHAFAVWSLTLGSAMLSGTLLRFDLGAVIPLLMLATFSLGGLVPFEANLLFNVTLTRETGWTAALVLIAAAGAYVALGDRQSS